MRRLVPVLLTGLVIALACGGSDSRKRKGARAGAHSSENEWRPPAIHPCEHPYGMLIEKDFEDVQARYCDLCGEHDSDACVLDWPWNDVPTCDAWDYYRNCIYAWYGYPFESARWKKEFASQSWYTVNPDFSAKEMSVVARRNVKYMQKAKASKKGCMD